MVDVARTSDPAADVDAEQPEPSAVVLDLTDLELEDVSTDLCLALARAFFRRGQTDEAQRLLDIAWRAAYDTVSLADQCAEVALELGQAERARELLEARLAKSEAVMAYRILAQVYLTLGQQDKADRLCKKLEQEHRGQIAMSIVGDVALACNDIEAARAAYAEILRRSPTSTSGLLGMARYHAAAGDEDAARRELTTIFAAYGDHPSGWILRATREIAGQLGDVEWQAELDARLTELDARGDAQLAERLHLARQGQGLRRQETPQRFGRRVATPVPRPGEQAAEADTETDEEIDEALTPEPIELASDAPPELLEALRDHFGYESFRPGQVEVIQAALRGEDTLALMPTGAGKSLCYQLPAMLLPGATVLISPLIALMRDQVQNLPESMRARTAFINSELDTAEQERRLRELAEGRLKLVYVAPERLRQPTFIHALRRARVSLFVIDEAHCISQWGHDFRPDYLFIPKALRAMAQGARNDTTGAPPILALTATATLPMRQEIGAALGRRLRVVTTGVFRPNLRYEVEHLNTQEEKLRALAALCAETGGSGIVYARSRESCEKLASFLRQQGIEAAHYHAGMLNEERARTQDAFMRGKTRVIVATVAFGMGIDKADVRFIIHYNLPNSLEAYCQESGRAGRDGRPARCVLFYAGNDKSRLSQWLREEALDLPFLRLIYGEIRRQIGGKLGLLTSAELERSINTLMRANEREASETMVRVGISLLERGGLLARHFDAPRTAYITWAGVNGHQPPPDCGTFIAAAQLRPGVPQSVDLTALAARLSLSVPDLEERLLTWRDADLLEYRGANRQMLVEMLPAPSDATQRLQTLLDTLQAQREAQIERLASYARSTVCRHKTIARHFAESLSGVCGVCDRCAPAHPSARAGRASKPALRRQSNGSGADLGTIEQTILLCLLSLPNDVGKTGLARTLNGSIAAPSFSKRNAYYGRLADRKIRQIETTIEVMVSAGYLERDVNDKYRLLTVTEQGHALIDGA